MATDDSPTAARPLSRTRTLALGAGPLVAIAMLVAGPPEGLSHAAWHVAAVGALMAIWWMTEALPLAVTALVPLVLFPPLGVADIAATAAPYANPLIFLFLGGFLLARALQVWGVDRHLAVVALRLAGTKPGVVIAAVMAVTAFLSMWISNTATAMVMLPIGQSILAATTAADARLRQDFAPALMLAIAYAATIGGMGTLVGTPPNALFAAYMDTAYGIRIGFAQWMLIGIPLVLILLPVTWFVLTRIAFRVGRDGARAVAPAGQAAPERLERGGYLAAAIMALAALGWLSRPLLDGLLPGLALSDAGVALACALLLFVIPAERGRARFVLSWSEAARIRWDVLILFGGGLTLAEAIGATGLAGWLGERSAGLGGMPVVAALLIVGVLIVFASELASNTATAAVFLPVAGATAIAMGEPAITLALPVALFATLGFMLPVATPPNAIVFATGAVDIRQMMRAGIFANLLGIALVVAVFLALGDIVFGAAL